jgi:hypothetical protein
MKVNQTRIVGQPSDKVMDISDLMTYQQTRKMENPSLNVNVIHKPTC